MIKQKIIAILMVLMTVPIIFLESDATATIVMLSFAIPMFFSKRNYFYRVK